MMEKLSLKWIYGRIRPKSGSLNITEVKNRESTDLLLVPKEAMVELGSMEVPQKRRFERGYSVEEQCKRQIVEKFTKKETPLPLYTKTEISSQVADFECRIPAAIVVFSFLQIAVFVMNSHSYLGSLYSPDDLNKRLQYEPRERLQIWRFVSYAFAHADVGHLAVNVLIQLIFGVALEILHGWRRVSIVYVSGIVLGSLTASIFDSQSSLVGASSGVYALIGAALVTVVMNWKHLEYKVLYVFMLVLVCGSAGGLTVFELTNGNLSNSSHQAHCGGIVAGILMGVSVLIVFDGPRYESVLRKISGVAFAALVLAGVCYHVFFLHLSSPQRS